MATQKLLLFHFIFISLACISCQKEPGVDLDLTPEIPAALKDSSQLIESITHVWNVGMADEDSITEHYTYDTANRRIMLSYTSPDINEVLNKTIIELKYNSKGLLSSASYGYPPTFIPGESDYVSVNISYDGDNVLQKIAVRYGDDSIRVTDFNKETLASGRYQLSWDYDEPALPGDKFSRRFVFDADGKNIINAREHIYKVVDDSTGVSTYTKKIIEDSLVYDNAGSVTKIFRTSIDTLDHSFEQYALYEYEGRQTKGDQMYNQRRLIMNGIANIPFLDGDDVVENAFGIMTFTMDYEYLQYSRYPVQRTKAQMWDATHQLFTSPFEFDTKDRLKKMTGFFHDTELAPFENRITYFR